MVLFTIAALILTDVVCSMSGIHRLLKRKNVMLQLNHIAKDYRAGDSIVHALKDVSIRFRPSEFVAILGPSGCGKTTLLNIIGGLDQYTSGDLLISGTSTRE